MPAPTQFRGWHFEAQTMIVLELVSLVFIKVRSEFVIIEYSANTATDWRFSTHWRSALRRDLPSSRFAIRLRYAPPPQIETVRGYLGSDLYISGRADAKVYVSKEIKSARCLIGLHRSLHQFCVQRCP